MSQKSLLTTFQEIKTSITTLLEDGTLDSCSVDQVAWQLERLLKSFDDASLLADLMDCLALYINLVSAYSTFQADCNTKAHKQAVFKYVSILNVLTMTPCLQNLLLPSVTPLIINILCDPSITDVCGMEILRFFNNVARSTDKSIRYEIGNKSPFHIHKLADTLSVCGCFEYQMLILESIFLICSVEKVGELSNGMFPEASSLQYAIRAFRVKEFDKSARLFLNTLNSIYRNIRSVVADKVFLDRHQVSEPVDINNHQHPLWVDFNKSSIGIYCRRDSLSQLSQDSEVVGWELLTIFYKDIKSADQARSNNVDSPVTFFKFFLNNELHVMFASSLHLTSSRVLSLVCFDEGTITKMKDEILPLISENSLKEHTQDSTDSSSVVHGGPGTYFAVSRINPINKKSIPSNVQSEKSLHEMFEVRYHNDGQAGRGRQIAGVQPAPDSTVDDMLLNIQMRCQNVIDMSSWSTASVKSPMHKMQFPFKRHRTRSRVSSCALKSIIESDEGSSGEMSPRNDEEANRSDVVSVNGATSKATYGAITQTQHKLLHTATTLKSVSLKHVQDETVERQGDNSLRNNIIARNYDFDLEEASVNDLNTAELIEQNKIGQFIPLKDSARSSTIYSETSSDVTTIGSQVVYSILRSVPITMKVFNDIILLEDDEDLELQEENITDEMTENNNSAKDILSQKETSSNQAVNLKDNERTLQHHETSQEMNEENNADDNVINQQIKEESGRGNGNFVEEEMLEAGLKFACDEEVIIIDEDIENQEATKTLEGTTDGGINIELQRKSSNVSEELSQNKKSTRSLRGITKSPQEVGKQNAVDKVITNRDRKESTEQLLTRSSNVGEEIPLDVAYLKTEVNFPCGEEVIIIDDDIEDREVTEKAEGVIQKGNASEQCEQSQQYSSPTQKSFEKNGIEKIVNENSTSQNKEEKITQLSARSNNVEHHKGSDVSSSKLIQDKVIEQEVDDQETTEQRKGVSNECEDQEDNLEDTVKEELEEQILSDDVAVDLQVRKKANKSLEGGNVLESNVEQPTAVQVTEQDKEPNKNREEFQNREVASQEIRDKSAVRSKGNKALEPRKTKKVANKVAKDDKRTKLEKVKQTKGRRKLFNKQENESTAGKVRRSTRHMKKSLDKNTDKEITEEAPIGDSKQILSKEALESLSQQLVKEELQVVDSGEADDDIVDPTPPSPQTDMKVLKYKTISQKGIENVKVCGERVSFECPSQLSGQSTVLVELHQEEIDANAVEQVSLMSGQSTIPVSQQNVKEDEPANECGNYEVFLSDGESEEVSTKKPTRSAKKKLDFTMQEDIIKRAFDPKYNMVFSYLQCVQQQTEEVEKLEETKYAKKEGHQRHEKPAREYVKPILRLKRKLYNPNVESLSETMTSDSFIMDIDGNDRGKKMKSKQTKSKTEENQNVSKEDTEKVENTKKIKKTAKKKPKLSDATNKDEEGIGIPEEIAGKIEKVAINVRETTKTIAHEKLGTKTNPKDAKDLKDEENESDSLAEEVAEMTGNIRNFEKRPKAVFSKRGGTKSKLKDTRNGDEESYDINEKPKKTGGEVEDNINEKLQRIFRSASEDSSDGAPQRIVVEATVHDVPLKYRETKTNDVVVTDDVQMAERVSPIMVQVQDTVREIKQGQIETLLQTTEAINEVAEEILPIKPLRTEDAIKEKQPDQTDEKLLLKVSQPVDEEIIGNRSSDANESKFDLLKESHKVSPMEKPRQKHGRKKMVKSGDPKITHGKVTKLRPANRSRKQLRDSLHAEQAANDYTSTHENHIKSYIDHCERKMLRERSFVSKVEDSTPDYVARNSYHEHDDTQTRLSPWWSHANLSPVTPLARKRKVRPLSSSDTEDNLQDEAVSKRPRIRILQNITIQKPRATNSSIFGELKGSAENEDTISYDSLISDGIKGIKALVLLANRNIPQTNKWLKYHRMLKELEGVFKNYSDIC